MGEGKPSLRARKGGAGGRRGPRGGAASGGARGVWLYGHHVVRAALANPTRRCLRLVLTAEAASGLDSGTEAPSGHRPAPEIVPRREIERLLPEGAVHQGAALLALPLPAPGLDEACAPGASARDIVVVLDRVSDPQNVGAVLRSAAAFRARAVVVPRRRSPEATGALAKAASGALETVPLVRVANLARALEDLKRLGYWCVGLDPGAPGVFSAAGLDSATALVLGAEGAGLRRLTARSCDLLARLPISAAVESLNVSAACAVALYELARGR